MELMDCTDIKASLSAILDGGLDEPRQHTVERHIAECTECRGLLDEAERAGDLIAAEMRQLEESGLPAGFEGIVLNRTTRANKRTHFTLVTWTGWIAAAACLALALTAWFTGTDGSSTPASDSTNVASSQHNTRTARTPDPAPPKQQQPYVFAISSVFEGQPEFEPDPTGRSAVVEPDGSSFVLSENDADTLFAAANALEFLEGVDDNDVATVDFVRQVAVYDDLVDRLSVARANIAPAEGLIYNAETVLSRVILGPLGPEDIAELRDMVERLDLAGELGTLSRGGDAPVLEV